MTVPALPSAASNPLSAPDGGDAALNVWEQHAGYAALAARRQVHWWPYGEEPPHHPEPLPPGAGCGCAGTGWS